MNYVSLSLSALCYSITATTTTVIFGPFGAPGITRRQLEMELAKYAALRAEKLIVNYATSSRVALNGLLLLVSNEWLHEMLVRSCIGLGLSLSERRWL